MVSIELRRRSLASNGHAEVARTEACWAKTLMRPPTYPMVGEIIKDLDRGAADQLNGGTREKNEARRSSCCGRGEQTFLQSARAYQHDRRRRDESHSHLVLPRTRMARVSGLNGHLVTLLSHTLERSL